MNSKQNHGANDTYIKIKRQYIYNIEVNTKKGLEKPLLKVQTNKCLNLITEQKKHLTLKSPDQF